MAVYVAVAGLILIFIGAVYLLYKLVVALKRIVGKIKRPPQEETKQQESTAPVSNPLPLAKEKSPVSVALTEAKPNQSLGALNNLGLKNQRRSKSYRASNPVVIINYKDSKGDITERKIIIKGIRFASGKKRIDAYCFKRRAYRTFLVSNVIYAVDPDTGEILDLNDFPYR